LPKAASAERNKDWDQAVADLTRLLAVERDNKDWRSRRVVANEQRKDWPAAAADLSYSLDKMADDRSSNSARSQLLARTYRTQPELFAALEKLRPKDPLPALVRGRELALQSKWQDAKTAYAAVIRASPAGEDCYDYAALCLISGDRKAYDEHLAWMAEQEEQPKNDFLSYAYARAAALAADPRDAAQAVDWAESALAKQRNPWHLHAAGLAYYRAGQVEKAKQTLQESLKGSWGGSFLNQLVLGMVEHKLGNDQAARDLLDQARKWQQLVESRKLNGAVGVVVPDWLEFNVLMPELEALFAESPRETKP